MNRVIPAFLGLCMSVATGASAFGGDWPQWRGPNRDGISKETGLLKDWPDDGPKLLWTTNAVGDGYSTPAVVGDRIYLMTNKGPADEFLRALNVADGKEVWSTRVGKVGPNTPAMNYPGARATPTVDGESIYGLGSDGDLVCAEAATGKIRWQKNLRTDFGGKPGDWAYAESPLVDGEVVVVTPGGADATMVALNKTSGDVVWKCAVPEGDEAGYASVVAMDVGGSRQYVQFVQKGVIGVDAKTGKLLWRYDATAKSSPANIPTPVVLDDMVYTGTNRGGGGTVQVTPGGGGGFAAKQLYFSPKLPNQIGGSVVVDGHLYGTGGRSLMCVAFKTGDVKWTAPSVGAASILYADGMLYLHGENGDVALVEASSKGYEEKGSFTPPDAPTRGKDKAWAYPVVANGRLYIRDMGVMWCFDVKDGGAK